MVEFIGRSNNLALFSDNGQGVIIDTDLNLVTNFGDFSALFSTNTWTSTSEEFSSSVLELAANATTTLDVKALVASGRMYTIPAGAQSEAKKALEWRKEEKRGGTPVGLNTARTLAKGGQIGIEKVRHIAKYFPRHEVDKKGKGWAPGEDNFPSNGRIAWALWGGDAAWRWAAAIVERENKKAVTADGYLLPGHQDSLDTYMSQDSYEADPNAFKAAHELDANMGPEFLARVRLDGSGIDRLYKIEIDGTVFVWDECAWDTLGHVDGDIYTYDRALDDVYDTCQKSHVVIDASSAVVIAAILQEDPFACVSLETIDAHEAYLMVNAVEGEDWDMVDYALSAAATPKAATPGNNLDGVDTPEERSARASSQVRNALGRFAKVGQKVAVGGDAKRGSGTITNIDGKTGMATVKLDDGRMISVDSKYTQPIDSVKEPTSQQVRGKDSNKGPLDISGILAEPRTPSDSPKAHLKGTLPPLSDADVALMLTNWSKYVEKQRASYKPLNKEDKARVQKQYKTKKFVNETSILLAAAAIAEEEKEPLTPATSDIPPKYFAIVSPDDPSAVMDFIALVPESATSSAPMTYKRVDGKWVQDPQIVRDLQSPTPPDVIVLDEKEQVNDVLKQMDGLVNVTASATIFDIDHLLTVLYGPKSLIAAGGLDRNRGGAEELRRYWTRGAGAAKIRWGTPGDWTRCVRNLSKYMGPRAKGYCQLRHKEATGIYTGDSNNPGNDFSSEAAFANGVIEQATLNAKANDARSRMSLVAGGSMIESDGAAFTIPLVIPENLESGDGRKFDKESIEIRDLPLPLLWQIKTGEGHNGSVVVGRIDHMERTENGIGNARGVFDTGAYGREAERLVRNGFIRGVSADLDQFEAKEDKPETSENAESEEVGKSKLTINHARVMAVTIVPKPAFQECTIALVADDYASEEEDMTDLDGIYEESPEAELPGVITASGFLTQEIPVTPPQSWFEKPTLTKATPLTVDPDGRIYGHIAAWHVNHIGMPRSTRPPRSKSKYAYFHTGVVRTDAGKDMPVGQLTLAGGHASLNADAQAAAKHYDDTASAIADVHAGEDDYGIWVAGSLRPDATEAQIRALRASAPSGDWRPINGQLELVAVCQVNVPGFPIARAMVAGGQVMALVAAGAHDMAMMKLDPAFVVHELKLKFEDAKAELSQMELQYEDNLAYISHRVRTQLAKRGKALPDGSFPIRNSGDLKNAIKSYGRASQQKRAIVRRHIEKRARALKQTDLIPNEWARENSALMASADTIRDRAMIAAAYAELSKISEEERMALAKKGQALPDGSYPIRNEEDLKNAIHAFGRAKKSERAQVRKHIIKRARQLKSSDLIPEGWTSAASAEAEAMVASMRSRIATFADAPKEISDADLEKLKDIKAEADKQTEEEIKIAEDIKAGKTTAKEVYDEEGRSKYTPGVDQPRDARGKFRTVLARLKQDLGVAGLQKALDKVENAENLEFAGDYVNSAKAAEDLINTIDRLDTGALDATKLENVRSTAADLGKVVSNLPLPFTNQAQKLRFSDLPPAMKNLIDDMITRVEAKIGKKDADIATQDLKSYMSGADVYSQGEVQSQMAKLLRLLT